MKKLFKTFTAQPNEKFWCSWLHRYVYFVDQCKDEYIFCDIADLPISLTKDQVEKLKKFPDSPVAIVID